MFFDHGPDEPVGIAVGAFDQEPPFKLAVHIWVNEAGRHYAVSDGLPTHTEAEWLSEQGWHTYRHGDK